MKYLLIYFFLFSPFMAFSQEMFKQKEILMGCQFELTVIANNQEEASIYHNQAKNEISRIEKLISSWDKNSETTRIINNAGIKPVKVSSELFELIKRSIQISKITNGAFDISYASMDKIWRFDGSIKSLPDAEKIKHAIQKIGFQHIILDETKQTVFLEKAGSKIGFGAIGKGYAADAAKKLLVKSGAKAGIINASGDLTTWGKQPDGTPWTVGVTNPLNKNKVFSWFPLNNNAVVTSGNYEKFIEINGQKYSHIIDPRTGYPTQGIASVTVFAPKAELADALATSVFVMGIDVGLDLINQMKEVETVIVDTKGKIFKSQNITFNTL